MFGYPSIPLRLACVAGVTAIAALTAMPATASPVTYDITFISGTNGTGALPTSASFTYDSATPIFSDFLVVWNSVTFELTDSANLGGAQSVSEASACGLAPGAAFSFLLLSDASCLTSTPPHWQAISESVFNVTSFVISNGGSAVIDSQTFGGSQGPDAFAAGNDWQIVARTAPPNLTPEPSSLALLGLAGVALGWSQRRRRAKHFVQ